VRNGYALIPTLGLAHFHTVDGHTVAEARSTGSSCHLRVGNCEIVVPRDTQAEATNWWPLRRIRCRSGDRTLSVSLDDIDFFRNLADPVEPSRLPEVAVRAWHALLDEAWTVLNRWHPEAAAAMSEGLISIAPLADDPSWLVRSASTGDGFGAALISLPRDPVTLAMTMVHEFQHIKLGGLLQLTTLYQDENEREHLYAPWRPDPRPLAGLLQGVYAFFGITAFWRAQRRAGSGVDKKIADFEFAYARRQTWVGLQTVSRSPWLTPLGIRFVSGIKQRLRPWLAEPIPRDLARTAWAAAVDHEAGWRIRYLQADHTWVTESAGAWLDRRDPPPISTPEPEPRTGGPPWTHGRLTLYRIRLTGHASAAHPAVPGVTSADVALVNGEPDQAAGEYLRRIRDGSGDLDSWTGLALALAATGAQGWRVLLKRPELIHALYLELADRQAHPRVDELARWVTGAPTMAAGPCRSPLGSFGER
jgi:hypothetical protein